MKAVLASALTALVLVAGAWASNVTPRQLSALSKRVDQLQARVVALQKAQAADETKLSKYAAYNDRCLSSFQPTTIFAVTLPGANGSTTTFRDFELADPGATPSFWLPAIPNDPACVSAAHS